MRGLPDSRPPGGFGNQFNNQRRGQQQSDSPRVGEIRDGQVAVRGPSRGGGPGNGRIPGQIEFVDTDSDRGRSFFEDQSGGEFRREGGLEGLDDDAGPSEKRAFIAREQFDRFIDTFAPVEDQLLDFTLNQDAGLDDALGDARSGVNQSFTAQREQTDRGLSRFGASRTPSERASRRRQSLLGEATARDDATNTARRGVESRRLNLLAGGLSNANPRPEN